MTTNEIVNGTTFDAALAAFVSSLQMEITEYYRTHYAALAAIDFTPSISVERGSKNVRVVKSDKAQRSVHCFVRIADGAILKADGWKKPAKHARGSIYAPDHGMSAVSVYGAHYLR
jgi:hypothetical protein